MGQFWRRPWPRALCSVSEVYSEAVELQRMTKAKLYQSTILCRCCPKPDLAMQIAITNAN
jgi:hypothetical protein